MRTPLLPLVAAAVVLAACTSTPPPADPPATPSSSADALQPRPCSEVVKDLAIVTDDLIENGCMDTNRAKRFGTVKTCKNGQRLWEMDGFMGMSGKPMLPGNEKDKDGFTVRSLQALACLSTS